MTRRKSQRIGLSIAVLAAVAVAQLVSPANLAADTLPPKVQAMERRVQSLDPVTIEGIREHRTRLPEEEFLRLLWQGARRAEGDRTFFAIMSWKFKHANGKFYSYTHGKVPVVEELVKRSPKMTPEQVRQIPLRCVRVGDNEFEFAFDGDKLYSGTRQVGGFGPPEELIWRPERPPNKSEDDVRRPLSPPLKLFGAEGPI